MDLQTASFCGRYVRVMCYGARARDALAGGTSCIVYRSYKTYALSEGMHPMQYTNVRRARFRRLPPSWQATDSDMAREVAKLPPFLGR